MERDTRSSPVRTYRGKVILRKNTSPMAGENRKKIILRSNLRNYELRASRSEFDRPEFVIISINVE